MWRRELQHGHRRRAAFEPTRRHTTVQLEYAAGFVEEDQVEGEAHPERVHASAAREQQARAGALTRQQRESEQAAQPALRNRNLQAEQLDPLQAAEAQWRLHPYISGGGDG